MQISVDGVGSVDACRKSELFRNNKLSIRRSAIHRWGVFANERISKEELLEEIPYFIIPKSEMDSTSKCEEYSYMLDDETFMIGFGFAGLYNHSADPNADHEVDLDNQIIVHRAIRDIEKNEEITINYGEENAKKFMSEMKEE